MTVNELIEELRKYPQEAQVSVFDSDYGYYESDFSIKILEGDILIQPGKAHLYHSCLKGED